MLKTLSVGLCVVMAALLGCGTESSTDKSEWALMQGAELEYRGKVPTAPEFLSRDGYDLMAVPSKDGRSRIWIMLWPKASPFYKQMPDGDFDLGRQFWTDLANGHKVSPTVESALRSHLRGNI